MHRRLTAALLAATLALPAAAAAQQAPPSVTDISAGTASDSAVGSDGNVNGRGTRLPDGPVNSVVTPGTVNGVPVTTTTPPGSISPSVSETTTDPDGSTIEPSAAPPSGEGRGNRGNAGADGSTAAGAGSGSPTIGDPEPTPAPAPSDSEAAPSDAAAPSDGAAADDGGSAPAVDACGYPTWLDAQIAFEKDQELAPALDPDGDGIACEEAMA